jgi:hypothetical protein
VLIAGVVLAGGGAVIAAAGGSSSVSSASATQYCPDGTPKPPNGDCSGHGGKPEGGGNPGGPPEKPGKHKKHRKPKIHVHKHPKRGCYSGNVAFRISVGNKPKTRTTRVYRDGRMLTATRSQAFKVRFDASRLSRGVHTLRVRVRGSDGKMYTRTVRFRRC